MVRATLYVINSLIVPLRAEPNEPPNEFIPINVVTGVFGVPVNVIVLDRLPPFIIAVTFEPV